MRKLATALALGGICGAAQAQEPAAPDLELLEYLGSWQAEDDEWLAIAEWEKDHPPPPPRAKREADDAERDERERKRNDDEEGT